MSKLNMTVPLSGLFESIKGFKYSFHEAIADIVDNSVDAGASQIKIYIDRDNNKITINDDGSGMNEKELEGAITPWKNAGVKKSKKGQKGKYGVGLKAAAFSLGEEFSLHTKKKKSGKFHYVNMALVELRKSGASTSIESDNKETPLWKAEKMPHGTIVEIKKVNKRKIREDLVQSLRNKLGVAFYGLLEKEELWIIIDGVPVVPMNPLLLSLKRNKANNFYHFFPMKRIEVDDDSGETKIFKVSGAYIGRGGHWSETEKKKNRFFLSSRSIPAKYGGSAVKIQEQGLYISRNGRLITQGGWYGTRSFSHHHSPCRILIEFDETADGLMGVDHTKTKPDIAHHVGDRLNQKYINEIFRKCEDYYRTEGEYFMAEHNKANADSELKNKSKSRPTPLDMRMGREEKLNKAMPEYAKNQENLEKEIQDKLSDEWWKLVEELPFDALWSPMVNLEGEVTVLFNESHPGYSALFYEDDEDKVRQNLNNLFWTMATYEAHFSELTKKLDDALKNELKKQLSAYRRYVSKEFRDFD